MPGLALRRLCAGLLIALPFALTSCITEIEDSVTGPPQNVPITLANHTEGSVITILAPGESPGCPGCELSHLGTRLITLSLQNGQGVLFRAMFGGVVRDDVRCKWQGETVIMVDYLNETLTSVNWTAVGAPGLVP